MKLDDGSIDRKLSLDMTPLLDVVFILVLFFSVTTSFISPRELDALKGSVLSLGEDKRRLSDEVAEVTAALERRAAELEALAGRHSQLREEHAQVLAAKREEVAALQARLDTAREDGERLKWMMDALEKDQAGIKKTLASTEAANRSLREQLEQAYRDYQGITVELEGLRAEQARRSDELAEARAALDAAARDNAALESRVADLAGTVASQSEREKLLQALIDEKAAEMSATRERLESAAERGESLARRLGELEADLATRVDDEQLLRAMLAEKARLSASVEQRLASASGERDDLQAELAGLRELSAQQADRARRLAARVETLESELERYKDLSDLDNEQIRRIAQAQSSLQRSLADYLADNRIGIRRERQKLTLQLSDRILFDSGSAAINPDGLAVLRRVGEVLRERLVNLEAQIGGHTDNVPVSGARGGLLADNWGLSAARAVSVVNFLEDELGLDPDRMSAVGYGEHRPVASNDTPEGRARNRRIEIVLLPR